MACLADRWLQAVSEVLPGCLRAASRCVPAEAVWEVSYSKQQRAHRPGSLFHELAQPVQRMGLRARAQRGFRVKVEQGSPSAAAAAASRSMAVREDASFIVPAGLWFTSVSGAFLRPRSSRGTACRAWRPCAAKHSRLAGYAWLASGMLKQVLSCCLQGSAPADAEPSASIRRQKAARRGPPGSEAGPGASASCFKSSAGHRRATDVVRNSRLHMAGRLHAAAGPWHAAPLAAFVSPACSACSPADLLTCLLPGAPAL